MRSINLAGQNIAQNLIYPNYKNHEKQVLDESILTQQSRQVCNQKQSQEGNRAVTKNIFSSMIFQSYSLSNGKSECSEAQKSQKLQQISQIKQSNSPKPSPKIQQMDQTTNNFSEVTSSYQSAIGQCLQSIGQSQNKIENNLNSQLEINFDQKDEMSNISMSTQQRCTYSRNESSKSFSTNYNQHLNQQNNYGTNFEIDNSLQSDNKSKLIDKSLQNKYKIRSCVNVKRSTEQNDNDNELILTSQVLKDNQQIVNKPYQKDNIQIKRDQKKLVSITSRKQNMNDKALIRYKNIENPFAKKQIQCKKDEKNDKIEETIQNKFQDSSSLIGETINSNQNSLNFQKNRYKTSISEKQSSPSCILKDLFNQQITSNTEISFSEKQINQNKTPNNLHQKNLNNKNELIPQYSGKKQTQQTFDYFQNNLSEVSVEDRRMYEELFELSPLPITRKSNNENYKKFNSFQNEKTQFINQNKESNIFEKTRNQSREKEKKCINFISSLNSIMDDACKDRNISQNPHIAAKQISINSCSSQQTMNLSKSQSRKELNKFIDENKVKTQTSKQQQFSQNYKKIKNIIEEATHFKDEMDVDQAMLKITITKNVLPRKLGIVAPLNPNQKSINDALKKQKKLQSFYEDESTLGMEWSINYTNTIASQDEQSRYQNPLHQSTSNDVSQIIQKIPSNQMVINKKPDFIFKRSSTHSQSLIQSQTKVFDYNNGIIQQEKRRNLDNTSFNNSNEIATYLQKNCLAFNGSDVENKDKINLNLSRLQISQTYCEMLASALRHSDFQNLNSLNLQDNNLTGNSIEIISKNLPCFIKKINLSNNFLNSNDGLSICNMLNSKNYAYLISLNLSNNQLTDVGLKTISLSLQNNLNLLSIELSHNKITDLSGNHLKNIVWNNSRLQELYLSWNKISSKCGNELSIGLTNNFTLKVLDLSHNCLGQNPNLHCGKKLIESCTKLESGLIHIDFSYNLFKKPECLEISIALSKNKKIYGFHFEGNDCHATIDTRGFIFFPDYDQILQKHVSTHTLMRRDIKSVKCLGLNKLQNFNCNVTDNCWICDGWQEIEFDIREGINETFLEEPAFLHLDFEDFKPMYMDRDVNDPTRFFLRRMCPPNRRILFFFTNPCTKVLFESNDYNKVEFYENEQNLEIYENEDDQNSLKDQLNELSQENNLTVHHLQHSKQRKFNVKYLDGTVIEYIVPTTVNVIRTRLYKNIFKNKGEYEVQIKCIPRQEETYYKINYSNQWHRGISLFKQYIPDSPELEQKCFEDDWNNCKLAPIFQQQDKNSDLIECKKIISEKYPQIRVVYRYLSCFGVSNNVFCVTFNPFSLFAQQSKIVDHNLMKMRDLECIFISSSTKALKIKNYRAPEKALIRSEFIESIGRLAIDKFIRNKTAKTAYEALNLLLNNEAFKNHISEYEEPQKWRQIRFWTKQCDEVMKKYLNFIKTLWNLYADSRRYEKKSVSNQKTMNLQEFLDMVYEFNIKDNLLTEREVVMSFNLSLMSIIDEINSEKYMAMTFVEFLEGLARLSEFKSRTPVGEREEAYKVDEKVQIKLQYKIESLLEYMSLQYLDVMKIKRKKQLILQKQLQQGNSTRLQSLKVRKSFIQYSQPELSDQNKFKMAVQKVMNSLSNINSSNQSMNQMNSQSEISRKNNQLQKIDQLNDEFEEEDQQFSESSKMEKLTSNESQSKDLSQIKNGPHPLHYIEEQN